jgi:hypothetical protein
LVGLDFVEFIKIDAGQLNAGVHHSVHTCILRVFCASVFPSPL